MDINTGKRRPYHHTPTILIMNLINKTKVEQYVSTPIYPMLSFICTVASTYVSLIFEWVQVKLWPEELVLVRNTKKLKY